MVDVNKKAEIGRTDAADKAEDAKAEVKSDEGIVIVDVETLLADKIPDIGTDSDAASEDAAAGDKSHSAFADALEDALGTSYEGDAGSVDDDDLDPLEDILRETELDNASAVLQSSPASSGGRAGANAGSGTMGSTNSDDDPSVVFGVFPPSYSNMPGGQPAGGTGAPAMGAGGGSGRHRLDGDDEDGWENRALIAASGKEAVPVEKSGRSALAAGALGMLGGLAIVGGAATYAVKNDMVSLRGFTPQTQTQTAQTQTQTQTVQSRSLPTAPAPQTPAVSSKASERPAPAVRTASLPPQPRQPVQTSQPATPPVPAGRISVSDVKGVARDPIPLVLVPQDMGNNPDYYIRVNGVPPGARLSGGLNEGGGSWLLRPSGLKDVALKVPSYFTGSFTLGAQLVREDGKTPITDITPFKVDITAEQVAAAGAGVEQRAARVVKQIATADKPKAAAFEPPADDLDKAPLAPEEGATDKLAEASVTDRLAALPGGTGDDEEVEEEGLGALPTDFVDNPAFLKQSGIRPPLRAARAPRRSLLASPPAAPAGRVAALRQPPAIQEPPIRAPATRSDRRSLLTARGESRAVPSAASLTSLPAAQTTSAATADDAELRRLIRKGDKFYRLGDLASARLFYMRAYESGSALGAMSVGRTYDPVYFQKLGVRGFQPNPQKALEWYRKAIAQGLALARTKVADLNNWLGR